MHYRLEIINKDYGLNNIECVAANYWFRDGFLHIRGLENGKLSLVNIDVIQIINVEKVEDD